MWVSWAFLGHNGKHGCCLKEFTSFEDSDSIKRDYSGYDRETWPIQTLADHHKHCLDHLQADTNSKKKKIETENGVRYSVLLELPYFNPIRYAVV